jgi:hypothetical protein
MAASPSHPGRVAGLAAGGAWTNCKLGLGLAGLHEQGWRRKKRLHATDCDTPRVHALRGDHVEVMAQRTEVARFHFLNETGLRLDYTRRYARALGGQRVGQPVLLKRGRSLTFIRALSVRGP